MTDFEEVVAVIPVKEGSERIADKNFRPFGEHPTLFPPQIHPL